MSSSSSKTKSKRKVKKVGKKTSLDEVTSYRRGPPSPLAPTPALRKKKKKSIATRIREEALESDYAEEESLKIETFKEVNNTTYNDGKRSDEKDNDHDDYADDGFEDYDDDDFEDPVEDEEKLPSEPRIQTTPASLIKSRKPLTTSRNQFAPELQKRPQVSSGGFATVERPKRNESTSAPTAASPTKRRESIKRYNLNQEFNDSSIGVNVGSTDQQARDRRQALRDLLKLEQQKNDVFEMHSMQPWEFYMRSLGPNGSKRQVFTQTGDDDKDMEVQTDMISSCDKGVNFPENDCVSHFETQIGDENEHKEEEFEFDSLDAVARICEILVVEEQQSKSILQEDEKLVYSKNGIGSQIVNIGQEVQLGVVLHSTFCINQPNILLTLHLGDSSKSFNEQESKACLCLWNLYVPAVPQLIIHCNGNPTKCVLSPWKPSIAITGTQEGSLHLWDLRNKYPKAHSDVEVHPSYTTDMISSPDKTHMSPITDIQVLVPPSGQANQTTVIFQFATLDESGIVHIWTTVEVFLSMNENIDVGNEKEDPSFDQGLTPGAKVKIIHSSRINVFENLKRNPSQVNSFTTRLAFRPDDFSHFLITTEAGYVIKCSRFGQLCSPTLYEMLNENNFNELSGFTFRSPAVCIDFNPIVTEYFLVAYEDGRLALFNVANALPVKTWDAFTTQGNYGSGHAPITAVVWSSSCPVVFFVLDQKHRLYLWDLAKDSEFPVSSEPIHCKGLSDSESAVSQICLSSTENKASGTTLAMSVNAQIRVQNISQYFSRPLAGDEAKSILLSI